jgi:hypothetical protein
MEQPAHAYLFFVLNTEHTERELLCLSVCSVLKRNDQGNCNVSPLPMVAAARQISRLTELLVKRTLPAVGLLGCYG